MLKNTLNKKYINEETISRGSGYKNKKIVAGPKSPEKSKASSSSSSTPSLVTTNMEILPESQSLLEDFDFKELEDLTCVVNIK